MTDQASILKLAKLYCLMVETLAKNKDSPSPEQILGCLINRDQIAYLWQQKGLIDPTSARLINQGDRQLRSLKEPISQLKELKDWRKNFTPPPESWWWFKPAQNWLQRFDWLWIALALLFLTLSAALITDIAPRFLSGGPDTRGALIVVIQSMVALLTTSSVLTKTGREAGQRILASINISKDWWQEIGAMLALLLLTGLFLFHQYLPKLAITYNDNGLIEYCAGHLAGAQSNYKRALKLNPDYLGAHFNLGLLYEDLQDVKRAKTEYQIARQRGLVVAQNNLARIYILEKNYAPAIPLLLSGLQQLEKAEIKAELVRCQPAAGLTDQNIVAEAPLELLHYDMLKNLGWARLGQERYNEANINLQTAIDLIDDRASAYCLRAQVLEGLNDPVGALKDWESCLQYASSFNSDEDVWLGLARQRFETGTNN